ncbi:type VII secretion integral membrane protein EccD [Mycolicibacterium mageritense]|uniref:type VII secretion integral membrane protein EccD n=1 Tax=Mycolicibacterium mageritense TaxID=53462 RepID=UPI0011D8D910|nr:type VII secretion integral membrane protein EccD [Mycolicibacterium mageritense]TXI55749.1 MAG: type VII secretion integral membrane protein EccD [Mycolicibacterium mageritense]
MSPPLTAAVPVGDNPDGQPVETQPAPVPASIRLNVLAGDKALVAMTLPAEAPLSMLVGPTVKAANSQLKSQGVAALPDRARYEFARVDGAVLSDKPTATLSSCGLVDGDLVRLVSAGTAVRFVPQIESLGSALAHQLRQLVKPVTPDVAHTVAVSTIIVAALAAAAMIWRSRLVMESGWIVAAVVLAVLAVLGWAAAGVTAQRWPTRVGFRDAFTATAIVLSASALAAAPPGVGVANVFAGAVTVAAGGIAMAVRTKRYWSIGTALLCVGSFAAAVSMWSMFWPLSSYQIAVVGLVSVTVLITRTPKLGLSWARIPRQPFRSRRGRDQFERAEGQPMETVSPVEDRHPDPTALSTAEVVTASRRSRGVLIGLCTAIAVIQIVCAWLAVTPHANRPVWSAVLVAVVAQDLIIRARRYNDRVQAVLLVASSVVALMSIGYKYAWSTPPTDLVSILSFIGISSAIAVAIFLIGSAGWQYLASPTTRKAIEWYGNGLIVAVPLLAAYLLDIFSFLRTQGLWWL